MIKRVGGQWTTIQCPCCENCYKVLTGKFSLVQQCPYCFAKIDLLEEAKAIEAKGGTL